MNQPADDVILITGANKGIGRETARRLSQEGHVVVIGARDRDLGRAAASGLGPRASVSPSPTSTSPIKSAWTPPRSSCVTGTAA